MEEVTITQASDLARERGQHLSRSYLARAADLGKIKGRRVTDPTGRTFWLIDKSDLERYLSIERKPGVKKGSKKRKVEAQAAPDQSASAGNEGPPSDPHETTFDIEGAYIRIDPLQPGQHWPRAVATQNDIQATIQLRPYWAFATVWIMDKSYDRTETYASGRMGRKQEQRGKELLDLLEKHMRAALQAAGWHTETRAGNELWRYTGAEGQQ